MGWSADYPDPDNFLRVGFENEGTGWRDEEYDRLVGEARQLLDKEEWMALYQRADRILIREAPFLATRYGQSHFLLKPWVKRYAMLPIAIWSPWKDAVIEPH
jgi:oligopeptide transport system substrate-binding protein